MPSPRPTLREIRQLKGRIVDLEVQLFEAQQFERIASDKLAVWVGKHDELLIKYKQLTSPPHGTVIST